MSSGTFRKFIDLSDGGLRLRIEGAKARCMMEALADCSEFSTPQLLEVNEATGCLVFERYEGLQRLHTGLPIARFEEVGRLLARIHDQLQLPEELTFVREADQDQPNLVYVHGDFHHNNLALLDDRLVVFDWGIRPWGDELYTRASPAIDLASFLTPWLKPRWWDFGLVTEALGAFVESYQKATRMHGREVLLYSDLEEELKSHDAYYKRALAKQSYARRSLHALKYRANRRRLNRELQARIQS